MFNNSLKQLTELTESDILNIDSIVRDTNEHLDEEVHGVCLKET